MGIVVRVLQWRLKILGRHGCSLFSSVATGYGSPCLLLPPGIGFKNKGKDMLLFCHPKEKGQDLKQEEKVEPTTASGYNHFLDMSKNPPRIRDIEINTRTMWRGRYLSPEKGLAECVGSSQGWAAFLDRETCDFYLFNFWINPAYKDSNFRRHFPYIPLPPIETLPTILTRETFYYGAWTTEQDEYIPGSPLLSKTRFLCHQQTYAVSSMELSQDFIKRLALSRAPTPLSYTKNIEIFHHHEQLEKEEEEEAPPMVMIIHGYRGEEGHLAFCRLGDAAWTSLNHNNGNNNNSTTPTCFLYEDITYFTPHGKFYALTKSQNLEAWDLSCPSSPQVKILKTIGNVPKYEYEEEEAGHHRKMYLVESEGKLLMVIEYHNCEKNWFDVFVLMEPKQGTTSNWWEWMKITNLSGRILFVGINDSVSLPSHEFPVLIPNSIYFATSYNANKDVFQHGDEAIGVYDLKDESVSRFMDNDSITPFPTWIFRSNMY